LTGQHVSSDIIAHHRELPNCNYSFWFYSRLSLLAAVMAESAMTAASYSFWFYTCLSLLAAVMADSAMTAAGNDKRE